MQEQFLLHPLHLLCSKSRSSSLRMALCVRFSVALMRWKELCCANWWHVEDVPIAETWLSTLLIQASSLLPKKLNRLRHLPHSLTLLRILNPVQPSNIPLPIHMVCLKWPCVASSCSDLSFGENKHIS